MEARAVELINFQLRLSRYCTANKCVSPRVIADSVLFGWRSCPLIEKSFFFKSVSIFLFVTHSRALSIVLRDTLSDDFDTLFLLLETTASLGRWLMSSETRRRRTKRHFLLSTMAKFYYFFFTPSYALRVDEEFIFIEPNSRMFRAL